MNTETVAYLQDLLHRDSIGKATHEEVIIALLRVCRELGIPPYPYILQ